MLTGKKPENGIGTQCQLNSILHFPHEHQSMKYLLLWCACVFYLFSTNLHLFITLRDYEKFNRQECQMAKQIVATGQPRFNLPALSTCVCVCLFSFLYLHIYLLMIICISNTLAILDAFKTLLIRVVLSST